MTDQVLNRELVAEFFKSAGGKVRLNSLIVLQEEIGHHDGKLYISRKFYDVDYSRQFGYLFHMSGFGGGPPIEVSGIYFVKGTPEIEEKETTLVDAKDSPPWKGAGTLKIRERNRTRRISRLPKALDLKDGQDLLDWLQNNGIEGDAVWCSICHDYFPGSDDYNLCEHCWWCDKTGNYSTPDERCDCMSREDCMNN